MSLAFLTYNKKKFIVGPSLESEYSLINELGNDWFFVWENV